MKIFRFILLLSLIAYSSIAQDSWNAGVAQTVITPKELLWMAGYGSRKVPAQGKRTELYGKALALECGDQRGVVITLDLVGVDREFSIDLCKRLKEATKLERNQIAIATSHTHSGPVVGRNLGPLHYLRLNEEQQKLIDQYVERLKVDLVKLVEAAISDLEPVRVQTGNGRAAFAVNRRENKPYSQVGNRRAKGILKGPVDHDVPVLTVRREDDSLKGILFGYACHATVLQATEWNGDYPGYAQAALERNFPGATALFWAGCGGDQNPLPRSTVELADVYGKDLARAVKDVIRSPMVEVAPILECNYREIEAPLAKLPTIDEIRTNQSSKSVFEVARSRYLQRKIQQNGKLDDHYPYPIGRWKIGEKIDFVFLGGEVVVDYAIRIKRELSGSNTWVAGYANDVMAYIPSLRVLKEGGYEGGGSNVYYGLPTLWDDDLEETIINSVHEIGD